MGAYEYVVYRISLPVGMQDDFERLAGYKLMEVAYMEADRYSVGMTDCERVGMAGNCGPDCRVLLRGDCECVEEEEGEEGEE